MTSFVQCFKSEGEQRIIVLKNSSEIVYQGDILKNNGALLNCKEMLKRQFDLLSPRNSR